MSENENSSERAEFRRRRRIRPGGGALGLLRGRVARSAWAIFGEGARAYLGSRAFFMVDDVDAASLRRRRSDARALADRAAESRCEFAGVADRAGGKLCWFSAGRSSRRLRRFATSRKPGRTLALVPDVAIRRACRLLAFLVKFSRHARRSPTAPGVLDCYQRLEASTFRVELPTVLPDCRGRAMLII